MPHGTSQSFEKQLEQQRQEFKQARDELRGMMKAAQAVELIGFANAWGVEETSRVLKEEPDTFALPPLGQSSIDRVLNPLTRTYESCGKMDEIVSEREAVLKREDPSRPLVLIEQGREFSIDVGTGTLRYLDNGEEQVVKFGLTNTAQRDQNLEQERDDDEPERDA